MGSFGKDKSFLFFDYSSLFALVHSVGFYSYFTASVSQVCKIDTEVYDAG